MLKNKNNISCKIIVIGRIKSCLLFSKGLKYMPKKKNMRTYGKETSPYVEDLFKKGVIKNYSENYMMQQVRTSLKKYGESKKDIERYLANARRIGLSKKEISAQVQLTIKNNEKIDDTYKKLNKKRQKKTSLFKESRFDKNDGFLGTKRKLKIDRSTTRTNIIDRILMTHKNMYRQAERNETFKSNYINAMYEMYKGVIDSELLEKYANKVRGMSEVELYRLSKSDAINVFGYHVKMDKTMVELSFSRYATLIENAYENKYYDMESYTEENFKIEREITERASVFYNKYFKGR